MIELGDKRLYLSLAIKAEFRGLIVRDINVSFYRGGGLDLVGIEHKLNTIYNF